MYGLASGSRDDVSGSSSQTGKVELFLVTTAAFAFGTASGSRFVLGGKDFAGMDGGVAGVSVLKGAAEV